MAPDDVAGGEVPLTVPLTTTQRQRLKGLGAPRGQIEQVFRDAAARDAAYAQLESELSDIGRQRLRELQTGAHRLPLVQLEADMRLALEGLGFVEVVTPHIISAEALGKMGIDVGHPLREQVYWLERGRCLRPMLAPGLYALLRRLGRTWRRPISIFELGTCFRRDSKGGRHLNEFTMLNLVVMGLPEPGNSARLDELATALMDAAGITEYECVRQASDVYGETMDLMVRGLEVCSAATGPHPLDGEWGIVEPWVGMGFGLERLVMAREDYSLIERAGHSLSYLDGVRLNL
jgi:phenylalanyl-tRNA synthetase alpha chain